MLNKMKFAFGGKKRVVFISFILIGLVSVFGFVFFAQAAIDPVAYWKFDGYPFEIVIDFAENHHGQLKSAKYSSVGVHRWGMEFDGEDDYIEVPHADVWNYTGDFAIEMWVKFTDTKDSHILSHNINGGGETIGAQPHDGWYVKLNDGILYFGGVNASGNCDQTLHENWSEWNTGLGGFNDNAWHQIFITRDGNTLWAYKDEQPGTSTTMACNPVSVDKPLRMGVSGLESGTYYHGLMDEVLIYNSSFTKKEVKKSYKQKYPQVQTAMISPWWDWEGLTVQPGQMPVIYAGWHESSKGILSDYLEAIDTYEYRLNGQLILDTEASIEHLLPIQKSDEYFGCWNVPLEYQLENLAPGDYTLQLKMTTAYPILMGTGIACSDKYPEIPGCTIFQSERLDLAREVPIHVIAP